MPDTKTVTVNIPGRDKPVTVQNVPSDLAEDDFKAQFRQRHPEYFSTQPAQTPQGGGQRQGTPAASAPPPLTEGGKEVPEGGFGVGHYLKQLVPGWQDIVHALGLPTSMDEAHTMGDAEANKSFGQRMKEGGLATLGLGTPVLASMGKEAFRGAKGSLSGDPMAGLHLASAMNPLSAPVTDQMSNQGLGTPAANATGGIGIASLIAGGKAPETDKFFSQDLPATAHDIMTKAANKAKGQLWDAHQQVSQRVGQLKNDIAAADYQKGGQGIPVADLWETVKDTAERYKAGGADTPKFKQASQSVMQKGPYLTWKELDDLKSEVGSAWNKTADGTRDSGATNSLLEQINKKLGERAGEVGRDSQFKAYNDLWSTLKGYEEKGAMGKLLNAQNGASFFDVLRDPANKAELSRTVNSLSKFGLPEDFSSSLVKSHSPLHDYVSEGNTFSKLRMVAQHPTTAIPGIALGTAAGSAIGMPFIGGAAGALASVKGAARWRAASAISKLGGAPSLAGEMEASSAVKPVGSGERPTPPAAKAGAVNFNELASALVNQGYNKADAMKFAMRGIQEEPTDFGKAFNVAIRGDRPTAPKPQAVKPVSGGSPAATKAQEVEQVKKASPEPGRGTYAADPRTQEQILERLQELKDSQTKNSTIESRSKPKKK